MDIRAAEISTILKQQIKDFGKEAKVSDVGQVLSAGKRPIGLSVFDNRFSFALANARKRSQARAVGGIDIDAC